ncbi:MAG: histidine kinase dimerization/phospho-acceptor domain-containing protein [Desulfatirhabdiaceae bacterium]
MRSVLYDSGMFFTGFQYPGGVLRRFKKRIGAGGVAHEINNPINGIMNYAQLVDGMEKENPLEAYAREILHETRRIAGIVRTR